MENDVDNIGITLFLQKYTMVDLCMKRTDMNILLLLTNGILIVYRRCTIMRLGSIHVLFYSRNMDAISKAK